MSGSIRPRARAAALAMGVGVFGLLATAAPSFAAAPLYPKQGANCQTDGKIDGVGSTLANTLQNSALITGYSTDICGYVGAATAPDFNTTNQSAGTAWTIDPTLTGSGTTAAGNMIAYNWTTQDGKKSNNGSGEGLEAMQCRVGEFGGSDIPYTGGMLTTLNGAPSFSWYAADPYQLNNTPPSNVWGAAGSSTAPTCAVNANVTPPFLPAPVAASSQTGDPYHTGYPNTADTPANMMSFPIGAGAAALVVNLPASQCTTLPNPVTLPGSQVADVMAGKYQFWSQVPGASTWGCNASLPITRVVRQDSSGTTYAVMTYLNHVGTFPLCDGSTSFQNIQNPTTATATVNDSVWPDNGGATTGCGSTTPVTYSIGTGGSTITGGSSASMVFNVTGTPGAIGYGELANWKGSQAPTFSGVTTTSSTTVTVNGTTIANPYVGEGISGAGIPAGTTISAIANPGLSSLTLTLSSAATATSTGTTLTLANSGMNYLFQNAAVGGSSQGPGAGVLTSPVASTAPAANCGDVVGGLGSGNLPGGGSDTNAAVGIGTADWRVDPATGSPFGDITYAGDQWPICTFTYDFVYGGIVTSATRGTAGGAGSALISTGPLQGITWDQARTTYSYFSYVLSPAAQAFEAAQGYQQLPSSWLPTLRSGFQQNF